MPSSEIARALKEIDPNLVVTLPPSGQAHAGGRKRARSECPEDEEDDDEDSPFTLNCNQIRTRINALLRSGEMKVTEFQRHLGINSNSYGRFMKLNGPWSGVDNQTMSAAHAFFKKREAKGIKIPKAKKAKAEDLAKFDVSGIFLDGEQDDSVPIYDTCDDLRKKIQAHLRNPGVTQAGFMREIGKTFSPPKTSQTVQLSAFLKKKGPTDGCSGSVYYAAYVYFEKLRIKNGDKKTEKRKIIETLHCDGMSRKCRVSYITHVDSILTMDEYGMVHSERRR